MTLLKTLHPRLVLAYSGLTLDEMTRRSGLNRRTLARILTRSWHGVRVGQALAVCEVAGIRWDQNAEWHINRIDPEKISPQLRRAILRQMK